MYSHSTAVKFWVKPQVNKRVADEEFKDHSGDPFFPKVQWPPAELCPLCRAPSVAAGASAGKASSGAEPEWNEDEVRASAHQACKPFAMQEDHASAKAFSHLLVENIAAYAEVYAWPTC